MLRPLALALALTLAATACSGDNSVEVRATYFRDAATLSTTYETAALTLFDGYVASLESATAETIDTIYVDANKGLFTGLASEFGTAVSELNGLDPPDDVETLHAEWVSAAEALNDAFRSADRDLFALTDAPSVDSIVSALPVQELQAAYRSACSAVASLATAQATPTITCESPEGT